MANSSAVKSRPLSTQPIILPEGDTKGAPFLIGFVGEVDLPIPTGPQSGNQTYLGMTGNPPTQGDYKNDDE